MATRRFSKGLLAALVFPLAVGWLVVQAPLPAQEPAAQEAGVVEPEAAVRKVPAKPRGRLPAYYARVVTPQQREQIYRLQAQYGEQLQQLQEQIEALEAQRDKEVEEVLSDEQRARVEQLMAEAKQRREAAAAARAATRNSP